MNSKHLGDAFDHWKGAIIQRTERVFGEKIAVIPMVTDDKPWDNKMKEAYSQLINVDRELILDWNQLTKENRKWYFQNIFNRYYPGDLFIDPDIGVTLEKYEHDPKYLRVDEIKILLDNGKVFNRVILIYQHRPRELLSERVKKITDNIRREVEKLDAVTYECGDVAMLFFSYDRDRLKRIENHLVKMLSSDPLNRVKIWPQ